MSDTRFGSWQSVVEGSEQSTALIRANGLNRWVYNKWMMLTVSMVSDHGGWKKEVKSLQHRYNGREEI